MLLCSHLCQTGDVRPVTPSEWRSISGSLEKNGLQPGDIADFSRDDFMTRLDCSNEDADRFMRLIDRGGSLSFILSRYEDMGMGIVTLADEGYPERLKKKLGKSCPPLFYYIGQLSLLEREAVGYVGSRNADEEDSAFTSRMVAATAGRGYAVVSGGAKGVDSAAALTAVREGVPVIEFLSDSLIRKSHKAALMQEIRNGHVLLMSVALPEAAFNVGFAMMRNRYIYAHSSGTVVIRCDTVGKGGTWSGAEENLQNNWCNTFCRDCSYKGNIALIRKGAVPINESWDGDVSIVRKADEDVQPSLFDDLE